MSRTTSPPAVLVIADDLKLVESLRGAFGSACQVFLSPSVESGLQRVAGQPLCAVLMNLAMPGMNAEAAVSTIRAAHRDVRLLGFTPTPNGHRIDGCEIVSSPVDWKDLRGLLTERVTGTVLEAKTAVPRPSPPAPSAPAPAPPKTELPAPASVRDSEPIVEQGIASTFLRDEAEVLEHANRFAATLADGIAITARILRVSPRFVVCEVLGPEQVLIPGSTAQDARVHLAHAEAYRGPARLAKVVNTGRSLICEWALQGSWQSPPAVEAASAQPDKAVLAPFFERMNLLDRISAVFKAAVADVASALEEARQCLERVELSLPPVRGQTQEQTRRAVLPGLQKSLFPAFDAIFTRFEEASRQIPPDLDAEYHSLVRQHLHPLMLGSPFIHHVYAKPLGFAGDYGALQKLIEEPFAGPTLYARLLNAWLVLSPAGEAYRHRLTVLQQSLDEQAVRCHEEGRELRVLSIGAGAANEVVRFLASNELSNNAEITLADFNEETVAFARSQVMQAQRDHWRLARPSFVTTTIQQLVADESRMRRRGLAALGPVARMAGYDFIYCAGLFDYFSDRVCGRLLAMMQEMLAPGGSIVVCNFTPANPIRAFMKYVLDWNLIHRTPEQLAALAPRGAPSSLTLSPGGVEAYLHVVRTRA